MRSYTNPFRARTSEQLTQHGLGRFLRTFSADALDLLPDDLWNVPVLIRSAPGAGKTSLLRAISAEAVGALTARPGAHEELARHLKSLGALDEDGQPQILGFRVPLVRDYRSVIDLEPDPGAAKRAFLRLLDARIVSAFVRAVEALVAVEEGSVLERAFVETDATGAAALERLGGPALTGMATWARRAETEILDRLDAVLPQSEGIGGHAGLYSLRALSGSVLTVMGQESSLRPVILFDDGQELAPSQRDLLLDALHDRELRLGRWYTERYSAMEPEDLVGDGEPRRSNSPVRLEIEARRMGAVTRRGTRTRRFEKLLADIADRRATPLLREYDNEDRSFVELLDADDGADLLPRADQATAKIKARLESTVDEFSRYHSWFQEADALEPIERALRWREIEILVTREQGRAEIALFDLPLTDQERKERSGSNIREAAELWLRREFGIPYYYGAQRLGKLSAENIEQYLNLSAHVFDEMLAGISLRQGAVVSRLRQDAAFSAASDQFWTEIPERRVGGRAIQQLLRHIAKLCRSETYRPTAPYAPGVTGTALSMRDRARLLDPAVRSRIQGAPELFEALYGAIGHNLLRAETDRAVKNDFWMVLYLNRLTCVRYGLPLGYGGFREKSLEEMSAWMLTDIEDEVESPLQEALVFP